MVRDRTRTERRSAGGFDRRDYRKPRDDWNIRDRDCISRPGTFYFLTDFSIVASCFILVLSATSRSTTTAVHPVVVCAVALRLTSGRVDCSSGDSLAGA